ncbi:carboxypeptidase-like regulatory domain-containing protein [Hymenobacter negativus]|uniref:Carboxypeptidase-like regulatory domain-containing protein n=1 Tax=Hymenobacter negativus TaxID=2795026 RepID=A0ABS3QLH2_9BACT|nr:carboxypeptidase-like regulatory domain-containing protein [Hymenobacter negativus]MBO2011868.1 carboxypeptidase-like regulatory domain-containing protein [Hymenobacter negativus]
MTPRFATALAAFVLLFDALPSHAQYAYTNVAPRPEATESADPEDGIKSVATKVLHGVVQGKEGALPGATVWLRGTKTVVVTNAEGEFELRVPADTKTVELTCGFGGLQDETVRLASVQALGSVYLLRSKMPAVN